MSPVVLFDTKECNMGPVRRLQMTIWGVLSLSERQQEPTTYYQVRPSLWKQLNMPHPQMRYSTGPENFQDNMGGMTSELPCP